MDVTKPYEFIGFGAMDVTKPYEFIGFGAMDVTKPYEFIGPRGRGAPATACQQPEQCAAPGWHGPGWARDLCRTRHTLCYAIVPPGRKSAFQAGFWPDCYRESTDIGPL